MERHPAYELSRLFACAWLGLVLGCTNQTGPDGDATPATLIESGEELALYFDGIDDYATTGTAEFPLPERSLTLSMWVKPARLAGVQLFFTIRRDIQGGLKFGLQGGMLTAWRASSNRPLLQGSAAVVEDQWQHVAYTHGPTGQHCLYLQAEQVSCVFASADARSPTRGFLGTFNGELDLFAGSMDEVRVWTVTRTAAEIELEMTGQVLPADSDLVAYYNFNESWGTRALDRSGRGNHVSLGDGVAERMPIRTPAGR